MKKNEISKRYLKVSEKNINFFPKFKDLTI